MKKYLIVFVLFISMGVYGQLNSGSVYFSGMTGANLGLEIQEFNSSIPYNMNMEGGYFIKNRFSIGGTVHAHGYFGLGGSTGSHELYLGPTVRYYIPREDDVQIYYFGNPFFSVSTGIGTYGIAAGAGVNYFITEQIALEARGYYRYNRFYDTGFGYNAHTINFEVGISVFFPSISFFSK